MAQRALAGAALGLACALAGCTTVERMNIQTVAVSCDVERGSEQAAQGEAGADILTQSGQGGGVFAGALRSIVRCPGGLEVEADLDGQIPEPAP